VALLGCGRVGFVARSTDASADGLVGDSATMDGAIDAPTDTPTDTPTTDGPVVDADPPDITVGVVTPIGALAMDGSSDKDPVLTADRLEIFFSSDRAGGDGSSDIWRSVRDAPDDAWSAPTPVAELNTAGSETAPTLSGDGLVIMFSRDGDIFVSTRLGIDRPWAAPSTQAEINSGGFDGCPSLTPNALTIAFCSERRGGTRDLHTATRASRTEGFGTVNYLRTVSSSGSEQSPFVGVTGELRLLLASDRGGGSGGNDIYESVRADVGAAWGDPTLVPGVNGSGNDEDPWSADDGALLYFASDRGGDYDIYLFRVR